MLPLYVLYFLAIIKLPGLIQLFFFIIGFFSFSPLYKFFFITRPSFLKAIPRLGFALFIWLLLPALFFYAY
ncbi:hypothetical protein GA0071314_0138 [Halomonas sp. HL-93]|nr:hypothetical protein GA0071314_0138 [Halomonas sp. HL-93]